MGGAMHIGDVPEMVDDWLSGMLRSRDVYFICLSLFEEHEVEAVLSYLPESLRQEVVTSLRSDWDNDLSLEDCFIFSSASGEHPATKLIVQKVRRWIAQHPQGGQGTST
jgi:hypothetical protein